MKLPESCSLVLLLAAFTGCAHQKASGPSMGLEPLPVIPTLSLCLPRAMHASMALAPAAAGAVDPAADEERKKEIFTDYYESFLDAKEQAKYVSCLKKNKDSPEYSQDFDKTYKEGNWWLKKSQDEADKYKAMFPRGKRIVDVEEQFTDIDQTRAIRRLTITLRDGTKTEIESQFDKNSSAR